MNHTHLYSKRLTFQLLAPADAEDICHHLTQSIAKRLVTVPWPYRLENAHEFIAAAQTAARDHLRYEYTIRLRATNEFVGIITLYVAAHDRSDRPGQIGYWIAESQQRQGYALEAIQTMMELAKQLQIRRIWARIVHDNIASINLVKKVGMRFIRELTDKDGVKAAPQALYLKELGIETERLLLRNWREEDVEVLAKINQDPKVMEYYPSIKSFEETKAFIETAKQHIAKYGLGVYACELKATGELIGMVGSQCLETGYPFSPAVELAWRLAHEHWGQGYAIEAARAVVKEFFEQFRLAEIVAFTVPANLRSRRVMEKLGMRYNSLYDFQHPKLPLDHPLSWHVLYHLRGENLLKTKEE